jgi:D-aminoacyl-tRNA deacylase
MRLVVQRVSKAQLSIDKKIYSQIESGLVVLLGITESDTIVDIQWLIQKLTQLRIFSDSEGKMNLSVLDIEGETLLVSQFTLFASTKKGNRPSFVNAAKPEIAIPLYEKFIESLQNTIGKEKTKTGVFGADMQIQLINDGPVTIIIDSKNKE